MKNRNFGPLSRPLNAGVGSPATFALPATGDETANLLSRIAELQSALAASEQRAQEAEARVERLDKALDDARTAFNGLLNMGTRMQGELSVQDIKQIGRSLVNECSDHISDIRRAREARKEGTS